MRPLISQKRLGGIGPGAFLLLHICLAILPVGTGFAMESTDATTQEAWATSGNWTIYADTPENGGCYMERAFADGTILRLGLKSLSHEGYFTALNESWTSFAEGEVGEVYFDFGDEVFGGESIGVVEGNFHGGVAQFNNPELVSALANRLRVVVSGAARAGFEFTLDGTKRAIAETDRCRVAQRGRIE